MKKGERERKIRDNLIATWVCEHHGTIRWRAALRLRVRSTCSKNPDAGIKSETEGGEESMRLWQPMCVFRYRFFTNGASMVAIHDAAFGIFSDRGVSWNGPRQDEGSIS